MIKPLGVYRQNIKEGLLCAAGVVLFYVIMGIIGHYEYIDYCILHNIH
jgi:hypothetical protein